MLIGMVFIVVVLTSEIMNGLSMVHAGMIPSPQVFYQKARPVAMLKRSMIFSLL